MKIQKFSLTLISLIVIMSCSPNKNLIGSERTNNSTAEQSLPIQNEAVNIPPQVASEDELSKTVNSIKAEITSARVTDTGVEIGVCYATPDGGDWYPTPGHLFYGTYEVYPDQYGFTTEEKADENKQGKRCVLVYYQIDDLETITTPIEFSINDFEARPLELFSACQNFQERLATSSKAKAYGLKANCTENGDGSFTVTLSDHAESVAEDQANKVLEEIAQGIVIGPWEFTINEIER